MKLFTGVAMPFIVAAVGCSGSAPPATPRPSGESSLIDLEYVRIPDQQLASPSTLLVGLGGWHAPFTDALGRNLPVAAVVEHVRRSRQLGLGAPLVVIFVQSADGSVNLATVENAISELSRALAQDSRCPAARIILELAPVKRAEIDFPPPPPPTTIPGLAGHE